MKIPVGPPSASDLLNGISHDPDRMIRVLTAGHGPTVGGKYRHWDVLRHLETPEDWSSEEWWLALKLARRALYHPVPLRDTRGAPFRYCLPDAGLRMLHEIDRDATGRIGIEGRIGSRAAETYLFRSLVEEPITSSQLEGAATTREVAKRMIREGRPPRNRSERMIVNNDAAMHFIRRNKGEKLTPGMVLEVHRILTEGTLDNPEAAGRLRQPDLSDEEICVVDELGNVLHRPPDARELPERLRALCDYANGSDSDPFVHPVVRAVLLHFWLAYDHPFVDGNGRTARALFYWGMASQGYWLAEHISISSVLKRAWARYARSFLYTETDENDATYFLLHQLRVIRRAIDNLHGYLERKAAEARELEQLMRDSTALRGRLNHRQLALLNHGLRHQHTEYTIEAHRASQGVSYQTARTDLLDLAAAGLLEQRKQGRAFVFFAAPALRERLERIS